MSRLLQNQEEILRLQGMELARVCVATNSIRLDFVKYPLNSENRYSDEIAIDIEAGYSILDESEHHTFLQSNGLGAFRLGSFYLNCLIEQTCATVGIDKKNELWIKFENGKTLLLHQCLQGFDSFEIHFLQ